MKHYFIALTLTLIGSNFAEAAQNLYCASRADSGVFLAQIEQHPNGTYTRLKQAKILNGFRNASLICTSQSILEDITCTGFWNELNNEITEVRFKRYHLGFVMTYQPLKGSLTMTGQPWRCTIENAL